MKKINLKKLLHLLGILFLASVVMVSCKKDDDDDDDDDPVIVLDGFYIKGAVTPFANFDAKGLMAAGINEVGQEPRTGMYVKFMALKAGADGFNIVEKAGTTETVYGPATVESVDLAGANEQPNITVQKGTLGTSGKFTVPADGMYHIIIDKQTNNFVIAPVPYWAMIGGFSGWSDTQMPLVGAFSQTSMKYEVTGLELRAGEFKLRYGGGWKIEIAEGVKVNSNFGGEVGGTLPNLVPTLVPGGANYAMTSAQMGIYTATLEWTVADGFKAKLTKTGDVAIVNWTGVELDIVGSGVSSDNATAIPDPSNWNWGNVIYPEPNAPVIDGYVYTWTWDSVIFEANEGFKIRTKSFQVPEGFGVNFDVGYGAVDVANSSSNVGDSGGNIIVTEKGSYKVVITIDAENGDAKKVTITEVE